ncbi:DDE-type integrase/transposase/recombinase [Paenibacillus terreus]|uniref:DDE-type integrase/transposase/recombinase n=1 Tax=Paenibacillus terreus TaxID=1387834 RepID=A0ABV5B9J2_9BACL
MTNRLCWTARTKYTKASLSPCLARSAFSDKSTQASPFLSSLSIQLDHQRLDLVHRSNTKFKSLAAWAQTPGDIYDLKTKKAPFRRLSKRCVLIRAFAKQKDVTGLIVHSDHGFQYTSHAYHDMLPKVGAQISMSRRGNCLEQRLHGELLLAS